MDRLLIVCSLVGLIGASAGCGEDSYDTRRDAWNAVGRRVCAGAESCGALGLGETVGTCAEELVADRCQRNDCNAPPLGTDDAINACLDAISRLSCSAPSLPAECTGVI